MDGDRPGGLELCVRHEQVTGECLDHLAGSGPPPQVTSPEERCRQKGREIVGDVADLGQ